MKKNLKSTAVLVCICAVMAVLLALTNSITAPIIKKNQEASANKALLEVLPGGEGFEKIAFDAAKLPKTVTEVYKEKNGGYVITLKTVGYASDMVVMCGVKADGTVAGVVCLSSNETLGYEKTYGTGFVGKNAAGVDAVDTISGATKTTAAYKNAVKDALNAVIILGGGSVDLRTEEEILNDKLSEVLPAGEGKFERLFIVEVIEGIDAVYVAENGKGAVYVIGEEFIAVTAEDEEIENETVAAAHEILNATVTEELDLTAFDGLPDTLKKAEKTVTGNYILYMDANGYAMTGEYFYGDPQPICIKVSMTADGSILDCLTISQNEDKKYGGACANESFYGQFAGMTQEDLENKKTTKPDGKEKYELDAISGATVTGNAYAEAILRAFECVIILEGGSN